MTISALQRAASPGRLVYSSWFGDLGGGELRLLDHLRATKFGRSNATVLLNQPGRLQEELGRLGVESRVICWQAGSSYATRQWYWYSAQVATWSTLRRLSPRVVVCNTFFDFETTGRVAARLGQRVIWRARADTFPYAHEWRAGRLEGLVDFLNRKVARILATTEYEARQMLAAGVDPGRVFVVRNGVDLARYEEEFAGQALRRELGVQPQELVLAYVARMVPQKGYETFLDALALLKRRGVSLRALVAGDTTLLENGADAYKRALYERVQHLGLTDEVRFLGFRDDVNAVMKAADVFVLASLKEPFGTTVIEAMAAGRPVVASDLPGPRESVVEGVTGIFFPPGEPEALAESLHALATNPIRRAALGAAGRKRAEAIFDLSRNVAELDRHCMCVALGDDHFPEGAIATSQTSRCIG